MGSYFRLVEEGHTFSFLPYLDRYGIGVGKFFNENRGTGVTVKNRSWGGVNTLNSYEAIDMDKTNKQTI